MNARDIACPHCGKSIYMTAQENAKIEESNIPLEFEFVFIEPGAFMRGGYWVSITKPFYMQTTTVTQLQWAIVMKNYLPVFGGVKLPVTEVSWNEVQEFISKLNKKENTNCYRLPTEAEWEYACRAGSKTAYCFGDDESLLSKYVWYDDNSDDQVNSVATKKPNAWGLYDMHGNVWEWCEDWYGGYPSGNVINPVGLETGSNRVIRGGGWNDVAYNCRSAHRYWAAPRARDGDLGFRLVKDLD